MTSYLGNESNIIKEVEVVVMRPKGMMEGLAIEFAIDALQERYEQMFTEKYKGSPK